MPRHIPSYFPSSARILLRIVCPSSALEGSGHAGVGLLAPIPLSYSWRTARCSKDQILMDSSLSHTGVLDDGRYRREEQPERSIAENVFAYHITIPDYNSRIFSSLKQDLALDELSVSPCLSASASRADGPPVHPIDRWRKEKGDIDSCHREHRIKWQRGASVDFFMLTVNFWH